MADDEQVIVDLTTGEIVINLQTSEIVVSGSGGGNVIGPASSTPNAIAVFAGMTGRVLANTPVTIDQVSGNISTPGVLLAGGFEALGADRALTIDDDGWAFDNRPATDAVIVTLPASSTISPGWSAELRVATSQILQLQAIDGDTIVHDGVSTQPSGSAQSSARGSVLHVVYEGAGEFFITAETGLWDYSA